MPSPATILRRSSPLVLLAARAGRARQRRRLTRAAIAGAGAVGVAALIGTRVWAHRRAADGPAETAFTEPVQAHGSERPGDGGAAGTPFAARYDLPTPEAAARGGSEPADAGARDGEPVPATPPEAVHGSQPAAGS